MSGFASPGGGRASRNRLVGFGLALVILGWVVLVADLTLSDSVLKEGSLVAVLSLKADIVTLAQTLVITGLGLVIVGALRDGFGALNRFFDAVLQRSSTPRPAPMPDPPTADVEHGDLTAVTPGGDRILSPAPHRDRNYVVLPDGSVEVETLLGTRIFATLDEARDFIR
jgi:hypothetical protein